MKKVKKPIHGIVAVISKVLAHLNPNKQAQVKMPVIKEKFLLTVLYIF